jgi:hypothetical protein
LTLAVGVVAAYLAGYRGAGLPVRKHSTVVTSPVPEPAPAPFEIVNATATTSAFAATVVWTTSEPSTGRLQWGPAGAEPVLWSTVRSLAERHAVTLEALASATPYDVTIVASTPGGEPATRTLSLSTGPVPASGRGSIRDGTLLVDGHPFFPLIAWEQCPEQWAASLASGINLFGGSPCSGLADLLGRLEGRALAAGTDGEAPTSQPGLLGWFYPDEADARGLSGRSLPVPPAGIRFLTLTAHFFSGAAPLPQGRSMYPSLIAAADVVGFDLYPLQQLCRPDLLPADFDAQRELEGLAPGKPTFQWIEARGMRCGNDPAAAVTPATIRVESWLALAAGAHGLAYFPPDWQANAYGAIRGIAERIHQLEPALLRPVLPVGVDGAPTVRASARTYDDALYLIAVNAGATAADVRLQLPELADRTLLVLGRHELLAAHGGTLADRLPPLSVRIYVAPPAA